MDAWQRRFSQALMGLIEKRITDDTEKLVTTRAIDFADYKERVGFIAGMKVILEDARDLEKNLDRPESQKPPQTARQPYES